MCVVSACKFPDLPPLSDDSGGVDGAITGGIDAAPGPLGGATLAQTTIPMPWHGGQVVTAPGGGVVVSFFYQGPQPPTIAGTTVPCMTCQIVAKLNNTLDELDWYVFIDTNAASLATSPDGSIYWTASARSDFENYSVTIRGSAVVTPISIPVPSHPRASDGGSVQIVVSLSDTGVPRWTNVLGQTDTGTSTFLDDYSGLAASSGAIWAATSFARGTLSYTNASGLLSSKVVAADSHVIHEIDPSTGRTVQLLAQPNNTAGPKHAPVVGTSGFAGRGFIVRRDTYDPSGAITAHALVFGSLGNGAFAPAVEYAISTTPALAINSLGVARYKSSAVASAAIQSSITIGSDTYAAPATNTDAMFFVLDGATATVRASAGFGGNSFDRPAGVLDIGNDDVYCLGLYRSSDLTIGGVHLPVAADALSDAIFAVRARVDLQTKSLVPTWARGISATAGLFVGGTAVDALTGDLYLFGALGPSGSADLGSTPITSGPNTPTAFIVKIQRGS